MDSIKVPGLRKPCPIASIVCIEGDTNYAWLHFLDGKKFLASHTLKWFDDRLPSFLRISKSSLINPAHVVVFKRTGFRNAEVSLSNGAFFLVSRRRVQSTADLLDETHVRGLF